MLSFNKIAILATAHMAADKEAIHRLKTLSVSCPYEIIVYSVLTHINTPRMHTISRYGAEHQMYLVYRRDI